MRELSAAELAAMNKVQLADYAARLNAEVLKQRNLIRRQHDRILELEAQLGKQNRPGTAEAPGTGGAARAVGS